MMTKLNSHQITTLFTKNILLSAVVTFYFILMSPALSAAENEKVQLCIACHNKDTNNVGFAYPDLMGLKPEYIIKQLKDYQSGKRESLFMGPISTQIAEKDFELIANYFSEKPRIPDDATDPELRKQGEHIFTKGFPGRMDACTKCHGNEGEGTAKYPRLNGQHPQYLVQELKNFKSGKRSNDANEEMRKIARQLTESDMQAVAHYLASLKEEMLEE